MTATSHITQLPIVHHEEEGGEFHLLNVGAWVNHLYYWLRKIILD